MLIIRETIVISLDSSVRLKTHGKSKKESSAGQKSDAVNKHEEPVQSIDLDFQVCAIFCAQTHLMVFAVRAFYAVA